MFALSTTTLVASTSRVPAKRKTGTAIKEVLENKDDSIAVSKRISVLWDAGIGWCTRGSESFAYIQPGVYSTRLDVAKSYHDGIATLALSIKVPAYTYSHTSIHTLPHNATGCCDQPRATQVMEPLAMDSAPTLAVFTA